MWHAVRGDAVPTELKSFHLHALEKDALIWTEGLADWLPMGDVPPIDQLPPLPRVAADTACVGVS